MSKNPILALLCVVAMSGLVGCGSRSSGGSTPPPTALSIAFQPPPPSALVIIETATFAATVSNDPMDLGVDWTVNCSLNSPGHLSNCGSLSSGSTNGVSQMHTASGATVTYVPPASFPINTETVYITAVSTADNTKSVFAPIVVSGFAGNLQGTYVFSVTGTESASSQPFALAGVLVADGNGNITLGNGSQFGGELTYTSATGTFSDNILSQGSSYSINPDGTGTITLSTGDPNLPGDNGAGGVEIFAVVLVSAPQGPQALISQSLQHNSLGTLELQTSTTVPSQGYAFAVEGMTVAIDPISFAHDPLTFGGVFNIDSPGGISGTGSVADEEIGVVNSGGTSNGVIVNKAPLHGLVIGPDSMGKVTIQLSSTFAPAIQFSGYVVDGSHLRLVESDYNQVTSTGFAITGGVAIGQGSATGSFHDASAFSGTFAYGIFGQVPFLNNPGFLSLAGLFTADGGGNLTNGFTDATYLTFTGVTQISDALTGTYAVDNTGTGRVIATTTFSSNSPGPTLIFYLTGNTNTLPVLNTDVQALGSGTAYSQQAAGFSFSGPYGLGAETGYPIGTPFVGSFTANATQGAITGTIWTGTAANAVTGSFTSGSSPSGRFTGSFSSGISQPAVAFYPIDSNRGLFTETDGSQIEIGNFASRTPLCASCPGSTSAVRHSTAAPIRRPVSGSHADRHK